MTDERAVLVMAKAPRPGLAKTRLAPMLGDDRCACLQTALITRAVAVATSVAPGATFVAFDPPDAWGEVAGLVPRGVELVPQCGGHLGERLAAAVTDIYAFHQGLLVVVGTDIPLLGARHLRDAFAALAGGDDVVLGPAYDGGYYLAGMNRPEPSLFDIAPQLWGGPDVLSATTTRVRAVGLRVGLLEVLRDLDTPEDAMALAAEPSLPSALRPLLGGPVTVSRGEGSHG
ncbi:MAG: TIGR04282 family arsenosugar biosynthesis glycosyltransferase [Actinomycetota bacterium]|nr:TIGR04282 family arsenosugar biosynthesis glycosyltransferase [Actinomycetota bacterium]MDA8075286.1 TIGR04282 family arsenosugar biosynthesis glycosyltransferase [Actinomycetota bacterium]MDA8365354.1 TIGR04282 family arsenosugar biosynthesis glycosyltransferase [Actinomycetota bacterium]